jgi:hypothetical protein
MPENSQPDAAVGAVAEVIQALVRTERIVRTYPSDHQMSQRAISEFEPRLAGILPLDLQVQSDQFAWKDHSLLDKTRDRSDLPTRLYRDGIRRLRVAPGIDEGEISRLLLVIATVIRPDDLSDDYVTQLWEANLPHVCVTAIDPYLDLDVPDEVLEGKEVPTGEAEGISAPGDLDIPPPPDEAFHIGPEDAERVAEELERAEECPPWENFIAALFDAVESNVSADRVADVVDLLEATFHRLLVDTRLATGSGLLERMRGNFPAVAERPIRQAVHRIAHPERLAPVHRALEADLCSPAEVERLLLAFGDCAVESICALLVNSRDERTRRFYGEVLVKSGVGSIEPVMAHLQSTSLEARVEFTRVLGLLRDARSIPALVSVISDEEPSLRREGARALAKIGGAPALTNLLKLALGDGDPSVRVISLMCLGSARAQLDSREILARIESSEYASLSDQEKDLLFRAMAASAGDQVLPYLRRSLQPSWIPGRSSTEDWPRAAAALAEMGTGSALNLLEQFANGRHRDLARICREALRSARPEQT